MFHVPSVINTQCLLSDKRYMSGYWPAKPERGQYPAILIEGPWSVMDLLFGFHENFSGGTRRVVPSGRDSSILPARVANHSARFCSSCPPTELAI